MINDLTRNGILQREYQTLHLFATSNPHTPISSFENGEQHFNYQVLNLNYRLAEINKELRYNDFPCRNCFICA